MATGDLFNNIEKLRGELRSINLAESAVDLEGIKAGNPVAYLPVLHFALLDSSIHVARFVVQRGYQLYPIRDKQFLEGVFRFARNEFGYRPSLSVEQFLSNGFAERKIILLTDILQLCNQTAQHLSRAAGSEATSSESALNAARSANHPVASRLDQPGYRSKRTLSLVTGEGPGERKPQGSASTSTPKASASTSKQQNAGPPTSLQRTRPDDAPKSPTSSAGPSGPASPVSLKSAASAPAMFRQAPIRVMPDMVGDRSALASWKQHQQPQAFVHQQHLYTDEHHSEGHDFSSMNRQRATECWVTSPPQMLNQKKNAGKVHVSPRIGGRVFGVDALTRSGSAGSHINALGRGAWSPANATQSCSASANSASEGFDSANDAEGDTKSLQKLTSQQLHIRMQLLRQQQQQSIPQQGAAKGVPVRGHNGSPHFPSSASSGSLNIARKLALPSEQKQVKATAPFDGQKHHQESAKRDVASHPMQPVKLFGGTDSSNASVVTTPSNSEDISDSASLAEQVSRVATALDSLSAIPERMVQMERVMMMALQSMDQRIADLDVRIRSSLPVQEGSSTYATRSQAAAPAPAPSARTGSVSAPAAPTRSTAAPVVSAGVSPRKPAPGAPSAQALSKASEQNGIDDFLKVIEERFRETETILQESQT